MGHDLDRLGPRDVVARVITELAMYEEQYIALH